MTSLSRRRLISASNTTSPGVASSRAVMIVVLTLGALMSGAALGTADARDGDEEIGIWLDLRDDRGRVIADPVSAGLEIYQDGTPVVVRGIGRRVIDERASRGVPEGSRVVLYFDAVLAEPGTYRRGAELLEAAAESLVALGTVELVIADPEPRTVLRTDDAIELAGRLGWLGSSDRGNGALRAIRQRAFGELVIAQDGTVSGLPSLTSQEKGTQAHSAAAEEAEVVAAQTRRLLAWVGGREAEISSRPPPRVLALVTDGWDLEPLAFWRQHLDDDTLAELDSLADPAADLARVTGETARALAGAGWTVWPVAVRSAFDLDLPDEALDPADDGGGLFPTVARRPQITFGGAKKNEEDSETRVTLLAPDAPIERLADVSGGEILPSIEAIRDAARRFGERVHVRYRPANELVGGLVPIELRARPGVVVKGRRWSSQLTPEPIVAARVDQLLNGAEGDRGFDVVSVVSFDGGDQEDQEAEAVDAERAARLETRLSLATLDEAEQVVANRDLRISVARVKDTGDIAIVHEVLPDQDLGGGAGEWRDIRNLVLDSADSEVVVLVEDPATGRWGGALASLVRTGSVEVEVADAPRSQVIEILPPNQEVLRGRVRFAARVTEPAATRVLFELDDRQAGTADRRPFSTRIDLGRSLRRQTLTAIALDADGAELGRHSVLLNGGSGALGVAITSPKEGSISGSVDVDALVTVPLEQDLDRVLFYWNNELLATQYQPPFRQRLTIPPSKPLGYVRVVAMLEDGTLAEDVVLLNGPQSGERVDVNLVELYVVVTDNAGRPVQGLAREDFEVRENGRPQTLADFSDAGDLPITLGLAIDSSASMFVKLPRVQRAATRFLEAVFTGDDRAFVVDFDSQPRLARGTTADLPRVVQAIDGLEANGRTALWESVVFSLVQLQGLRGRKALVVFSDGADEDDQFPYRSSLGLAKQMGVPIYMILMKKRPKKDGGFSLWNRSFTQRAEKLVTAGGGRIYYAPEYETLDDIYAEIEDELRSQYLLTYYPTDPGRPDAWRDVEVDVKKRGLAPRTLSGYWPP